MLNKYVRTMDDSNELIDKKIVKDLLKYYLIMI